MTTTPAQLNQDMTPAGDWGGYLEYHPRTTMPQHRRMELRDLLVEAGIVEEPENPLIPIDWFCNNSDGPPYTARESIIMYRDGGDDEAPGVLFCRTWDTTAIHIPAADRQAELADAGIKLWQHSLATTVVALGVLSRYLGEILNNPEAWTPYEFTDEYQGL